MSDLADALLAASRAAPNLDPTMLYGIAASNDLGDVPTNATATEALGQITKRIAWLKSESHGQQSSYWSAIGDGERQLLTNAGYTPPGPPSHHGGLMGTVGHALGGAADFLFGTPTRIVGNVVSGSLHAAGAGLRQVQHAYRADWRLIDSSSDEGGTISGSKLISPHQWARAWRESEHGERTFNPIEESKIERRYQPDTVDLARQLAGGTDPNAIILAAPEDQRRQLAQRIQSDPDLQAAVTDFNAAKYTLGHRALGPALQKKLTVTVPHAVPFLGGSEMNPVSGAIDATFDWYADPLVIGLSAAKGAELARYAINDRADVLRLAEKNPNVQRALADVTDTLNRGGPGALMERWPRLSRVATQLQTEGVDSPEKLTEWFAGNLGMNALMNGNATGVSHAIPQMLKLNPREAAFLELKGGLKQTIDWMADTPLGIATKTGDDAQAGALRQFAANRQKGFGRFARQATTLTPRGFTFDPSSPDAITQIQRLANYVLPADRVRDVVNVWSAAPDLATKRDIYKGLLGEMFDAAGITATEEGRRWAGKFTSELDDAISKPVYSASGADAVLRDGTEARRGLLEPHMTHEWAMPPFRELWAQSKRANTLGRVYQGTINADGVDKFMNVWKPTTLLRLGFPIRAGGEELVAAIMREGPLGLIRARAAGGAAKGELASAAADRLLPVHPLAAIWNRLSGHLPEELVSKINQPADYIGAVYGDRARRAFRTVEGRLAGEDYLNVARELFKRGPLQAGFLAEVSAVEARAAGYLDDTPTVIKSVREGSSAKPAYFAPQGNFTEYKPGENLYTAMWHNNLSEIADSKLGRAALEHLDDPDAAIRAVQDVIESPGFEKMAARSDRTLYTSDGRLVGTDATAEEAARDWAHAVVGHVNSLVRDADGAIIGDLPQRLAAGDVPTVVGLSETPVERMPAAVKGREVVQVSRNWARDVMDKGFQHVVGRPMDWMVRQPLFIHNYALAQREVEGLRIMVGGTVDLPPVPEGHVRLYRGEGIRRSGEEYVSAPAAHDVEYGATRSRWFSNDPAVAEGYAVARHPDYEPLGRVMYVDVPAAEAARYKATAMAPEEFSKLNLGIPVEEHEYVVPASVRARASQYVFQPSGLPDEVKSTVERILNSGEFRRAADASPELGRHLTLLDENGKLGPLTAEQVGSLRRDMARATGRLRGPAIVAPEIGEPLGSAVDDLDRFLNEGIDVGEPIRRAMGPGGTSEHADQIVHDAAMQRAINKTVPFIHDPKMRSQMSVVTRNLAPFWFAQEQFYKRWAKIFEHSPEAFRQAQLVMMGLRHSGVLHTDDQGNDYFIYPGASLVQNALTAGLEHLPGQKGKWKLPLPVGFSGQVRFATPGLERLGAPSFGPLVGIPMAGMAQMFPELEQTQQAVVGERGAGRSYWEMVTPTTVSRLVHLAIDSPDTSPQMASAMNQAIVYLTAQGFAPPQDAPETVREHFKDRVRNWARILFLTRMAYGYTVPASPELQMDPDEMSSEFRDLLKTMPIEDATAEFIRRNPDATPYTVFQSKSQSGAPLPATAATVAFMNDHAEFLKTYPQAGGWFLPQQAKDESFSQVAYREQLALEMRKRKSPDQMLNDVYYAQAADRYFRSRDTKDAALLAAKGNSRRTQSIAHQWDQWKTDYLATHPVFAAELMAPDAEIRRQETIGQLRRAMEDPRLPKSPQVDSIRTVLAGWDQVDGALQEMAGYTSGTVVRRRKAIRDSFNKWGTAYVEAHPEVKTLWLKTFLPQVEAP